MRLVFWFGAFAVMAPALEPTTAVRFSPGGSLIAIGGGDTVRLLKPKSTDRGFQLRSKLAQIFDVAWTRDEKILAVSGGNAAVQGAVELWDLASRQLLRTVAKTGDLIYGVAFSPDGSLLAAAGADARVIVADVATGETLHRLTGHAGPALCTIWSPDGATIATGSADRSIRIWSALDGKQLRTLVNHGGPVEALVFSSDSRSLYSAGSDATVRVWTPSTGRMKRIYRGFEQAVLSLDFVPSRQLLAAAGADGRVRLLNSETGEIVRIFETGAAPHAPWTHTVSISPDAESIAWGDAAGLYGIRKINE